MSTHIFRSLVLLLFVGGLIAFFLINPGRWFPARVAEPLVMRLKASPELQAWLEDARTRFLAKQPRLAGRPLSCIIDYEEDAASGGIVERQRENPVPSSPASAPAAWLTSRTAIQLLQTTHRPPLADRAVTPLASTLLTVAIWEPRARQVLREAGVLTSTDQPVTWSDVAVSWTAWHRLSIGPSGSISSGTGSLRWAIPHPLRSAAGLASLALMSLDDRGPQAVRWPDETEEQALLPWVTDFLRTVHRFRPSARETANDFVKYGPSQADVALLPEHLAFEVLAYTAERPGPGVVLLYPRVNVVYEYVFVDGLGAKLDPQQRQALAAFQRFVRSAEGQRLALAHGLRPALPDLTPRPTDPWPRFNIQGAQFVPPMAWADLQAVVEPANRLASRAMEGLQAR